MSQPLLTVEQVAEELRLHPKTVLRYIREGRLSATRIGKAYRIARADLDALTGTASGAMEADRVVRTTCITDLAGLTVESAQRIATFLQSAALTGDSRTPPLQVQTAFDSQEKALKIVLIGLPSDVGKLLELLHLHLEARP